MPWLVLLFCAALLISLHHSLLAGIAWAPALPLALCAWLLVKGGYAHALTRVWLVLLVADAMDPTSAYFHSFAGVLLVLPSLFVQERMQGLGSGAWFLWGACWSLVFAILDAASGGGLWPGFWTPVVSALLTGLCAMFIGGILDVLPRSWSPVPPPKDPAWATLSAR